VKTKNTGAIASVFFIPCSLVIIDTVGELIVNRFLASAGGAVLVGAGSLADLCPPASHFLGENAMQPNFNTNMQL
jgi:hypothetical protein